MPIPKLLLEKLSTKSGMAIGSLRNAARTLSQKHAVPLEVGALLLAQEYGVSYQRFATAEEMDTLRDVTREQSQQAPPQRTSNPTSKRNQGGKSPKARKPTKKTKDNSLFLVHGRDKQLNEDMFSFLRALGLNPMEWNAAVKIAPGANPNIGSIINKAMARVQAVLVMFSPDETVRLKAKFCTQAEKKAGAGDQSRPNVLFEAGLALGGHPKKTLLFEVGTVRPFSDIAGMHLVRLGDSPASRVAFAERLKKLGLKVDTSNELWTTVGNFSR